MESVFSSGYKGPCLSAAAAARSNAAFSGLSPRVEVGVLDHGMHGPKS